MDTFRYGAHRRLPHDEQATLVARYEATLADYRARRFPHADAAMEAMRRYVRGVVMEWGPLQANGIQLGWDADRQDVSRAILSNSTK